MTPEQWNQYFNQHPSPALEYLENMKSALDAGWIDGDLADVRLKEIAGEFHDLCKLADKKVNENQASIRESFIEQAKRK